MQYSPVLPNLRKVQLLEGDAELPPYLFANFPKLEEVILPKNLTVIGDHAFAQCVALKGIVLPEGLVSIGDEAFASCRSLQDVALPASLCHIGKRAFLFCVSLTSLNLPKTIESIGDWAFAECRSLAHLELDLSCKIGPLSFNNCPLDEIILTPPPSGMFPQDLYHYGFRLFNADGCQPKTIILREGFTEIPSETFYNCHSLSRVQLPKSLKVIRGRAILSCEKLTSLDLPEGVEVIEPQAMHGVKEVHFQGAPPADTSNFHLHRYVKLYGKQSLGWQEGMTVDGLPVHLE